MTEISLQQSHNPMKLINIQKILIKITKPSIQQQRQ